MGCITISAASRATGRGNRGREPLARGRPDERVSLPRLRSTDAALFDLDGVLVDSRVSFARCVNAALVAHGLSERADEELHTYLGPPLHWTFTQLGAGEMVQSCVESYRTRCRAVGATETAVMRHP